MSQAVVQTEDVRRTLFNMRLSEDESERLKKLAEHYGLNAAGTIRMLLKDRARDLGIETEEPAPREPRKPTRKSR